MIEGKSFLAIIPARGGSKRLPRKNLLSLAGKPLISHSIAAATQSNYVDEVMVSTEDREIAETAQKYGANVPFLRPAHLALDTSATFDVVEHALSVYARDLNKNFDYVLLLQPTSPLRTAQHIDEAIEQLIDKEQDAVVSVCPMEHSPLWSNTLPPDLSMRNFLRPEVVGKRSQDLPVYYRINGSIYLCRCTKLLEQRSFFLSDRIMAYIMEKEASVDIDEMIDFKLCEVLLKENIHRQRIK